MNVKCGIQLPHISGADEYVFLSTVVGYASLAAPLHNWDFELRCLAVALILVYQDESDSDLRFLISFLLVFIFHKCYS
jgi:hypothetical protein